MAGALRIRRANASDQDFILSLAPRFVAFDLPNGRGKRATLAAIRADIGRALEPTSAAQHMFFIATGARNARAGFIHLQPLRDFFSGARSCHIADLAVAPRYQGRGVGRALLAHAEQWAQAHRCKLLTLAVFPANARARALYERAGFAPDLIRMAKRVQPAR